MGRRPGRQPGRADHSQGRRGALPALLGALRLKLKVLFFAGLREQLGTSAVELEVPAAVGNVGALREHLRGLGAAYATALAEKRALRTAVNQEMAAASAPLKAGDEIAFFPPVTGG